MEKFRMLREKYPVFIYDSFSADMKDSVLTVKFTFIQSPEIIFEPEIRFHNCPEEFSGPDTIETAAFNLGMIELISYYKACCSPVIIVRPGFLDAENLLFWKEIYINGLGEFLYKNGIDVSEDELFDIIVESKTEHLPSSIPLENRTLIPVGGGKDSVVTLELLKHKKPVPFIMNPGEASMLSVHNAGYSGFFKAERKIAPKLLELNAKGYLNGHTPFSALLAFASVISAFINSTANIALSNEDSANEPNAEFSGRKINHQYSKTFAAEKALHYYIKKNIHPDINYFSFLRPLHEIKIAEIFSRYAHHFGSFRSCNAGSRENIWCLKCPKCLFTFIILSPFVEPDKLTDIFGDDLFERGELSDTFLELAGLKGIKPFECVGTYSEVRACIEKTIAENKRTSVPLLLKLYKETVKGKFLPEENNLNTLLRSYNKNNLLGCDYESILEKAL